MKTIIKLIPITLIILIVSLISSCEKKNTEIEGIGEAEFSINLPDELVLKSDIADSNEIASYHLLVSVEDLNGNQILNNELIPIYQFGSGFVSENVELSTGEFKLTKFMVINPSGEVIYATPLEGSPLAYLVDKPLPLNFRIRADQITRIRPEVLPVGNYPPGEFGYVNFGIQIIRPLHFFAVCILDNPLIMAPTQLTHAKLTVYAENGWHYTFRLQPRVNHLVIRGGSEVYYFVLEKEGYETQKMRFSARELNATSWFNPLVLKIPWGTQYKTLVLQPGPEDGKDAMITNLEPDTNFGDYKYFEATYLSESPLTVMRSNRSLIWFDMNQVPKSAIIKKINLRLSYDIPVPWDSTAFITNPGSLDSADVVWYGAVLQQIVDPWEEKEVTWNKQPASLTENQVYVSPFIRNVNFIDIDVTQLFYPSDSSTVATNHGMLFKLHPTEMFPGFRFASSDYDVDYMRPKLTIYYTLDE